MNNIGKILVIAIILISCNKNSELEFKNYEYLNRLAEVNGNRINQILKNSEKLGIPYAGIKRMDLFLDKYHKQILKHLDSDTLPIKVIENNIIKLEKSIWDSDGDQIINLFKKNLSDLRIEIILVNEIELLNEYSELFNSKFRAVDVVMPLVYGDPTLSHNQRDTVKFMVRGFSSVLANNVYLGDTTKLMATVENAKSLNTFSHDFSSYYTIIEAKKKGNYSLSGVMTLIDRGEEKRMPFTYNYKVK